MAASEEESGNKRDAAYQRQHSGIGIMAAAASA